MKTTMILTAAFALVLATTAAVHEPLTGWQRMQADVPPGSVEVRPLPVVQNWLPGSGKDERMNNVLETHTIPDGWPE